MKRAGNLFDSIVAWENLRQATAKALRGKRSKTDAQAFVAKLDANLKRLRDQLLSNNVRLGRFHQFTVYDPKERLITAPCFEERVLHHAILNVCEPVFERGLIFDSYACRQGKGRVACLQRAQHFAKRLPFFLKMDVRKYFDSIDHTILKKMLTCRFKDDPLLALLARIIDSYSVSPGKGMPIGSLTSQHFANLYLGRSDRFIKEELRISGYVRYMDDMALWASASAPLRDAMKAVASFLADQLRLTPKSGAFISRSSGGMDFLGCRVFPSHQKLNLRSRRRFRRKLMDLDLAVASGQMTEAEAQQRGQALVAFTMTAGVKSWRLRRQVIEQTAGDGQGLGSGAPRR